ncbi:MAG: SPOR domain-containing protein [Phaeodactylibacter sp.]|nr:SPOR domain-containing protein [Phaeodactylibacter sp.]
MQSRASAALAYLLALGVALSIYIGLGKAGNKIGLPWISKEETTEISSSSLEPTLPPSYAELEYSAPEEAAPPADSLPALATVSSPPAPEPPLSYPSAYEETGRYFVQLYAFREEARAWAQKQYWQGRLSQRVWVGVAAGEAVPYKVLVGPFGQRQEARRYLRSERLNGFPREQKDIRLYKD